VAARVDRAVRRTYALHENIGQNRVADPEQERAVRELTEEQAALDKF